MQDAGCNEVKPQSKEGSDCHQEQPRMNASRTRIRPISGGITEFEIRVYLRPFAVRKAFRTARTFSGVGTEESNFRPEHNFVVSAGEERQRSWCSSFLRMTGFI